MKKIKLSVAGFIICFLSIHIQTTAQYTKLLDFDDSNGSLPLSSPVFDGTFLYGMTEDGGADGDGIIYKIKPDGTGYSKLLDFDDAVTGKFPKGSLIITGPFLYGMTSGGGTNGMGTVFKILNDGTGYVRLLDFSGTSNGSDPWGSLFSDGTFLYGMTRTGGTNNLGTIFKIMPDGSGYVKLLDFDGTANGSHPEASLISDGTFLYGMTDEGGTSNMGTVFKIMPDGSGYAKLLDFTGTTTGSDPEGSLIYDGTFLFGLTADGGVNSLGAIFRIKPDGTTYAKILDFTGSGNGRDPEGPLVSDGTFLYGVTRLGGANNFGTIFKILPDGSGYEKLLDFNDAATGSFPQGGLIHNAGFLYGTTSAGGTNDLGTVYKTSTVPSILPTITNFSPVSGQVGAAVTITGTNFSSTPGDNTVRFNGTIAAVSASSPTSITTSIPAGATTGTISVTVGGNTATSASNFTVTTPSASQPVPALEWAKSIGGTDSEGGNSIALDASGNIYVTGLFRGSVDFDPGAAIFNLSAGANPDVFVLKLDASGNFVWAKQMGAIQDDRGLSIALDASGNVYTTGFFQSTVDFDPGAGTFNLASAAGGIDVFICKLDPSGNFVWAKSIGGTDADVGRSVAIDAADNVYISGSFDETVDFDPGTGTFNITSVGPGSADVFILKLDASGNFVWAKSMGGGDNGDEGFSIAIDASGNVYTTGSYQLTADFDPGTGTFNLTSAGGEDIFVSKLNASGNFVWAKSMGGTDDDNGLSIKVDATGNVFATGFFSETTDFDPGTGTFNLTPSGDDDIFVLKLDASGNFVWAKNMGGTEGDNGLSISLDATGNIYTTGYFTDAADFDPGTGSFDLTATGSRDIFISKLDPSGNFVWAIGMGGIGLDRGQFITLDGSENIYTTGAYVFTADFDPGPGTFNLTYEGNAGNSDMFIQKLTSATAAVNITFTSQPVSSTLCAGNNTTFSVAAIGDTNLQYQWQTDNGGFVNLSNSSTYSGVNTATLTVINPSLSLSGAAYRCVVRGDNSVDTPSASASITVHSIPASPVLAASDLGCGPVSTTLTPAGSAAGEAYKFYDAATAGNLLNSGTSFTTSSLAVSTTFHISTYNTTTLCESMRIPVLVTVQSCSAPVVMAANVEAPPGEIFTIDLNTLISDPDDNLDLTTLQITQQPLSGAPASVLGTILTVNYEGLSFSGTDILQIEVCDLTSICTEQTLTIELASDVIVYNGISPNGDLFNASWQIKNIDLLPETKNNKVTLYNRWGDEVFSAVNYDNKAVVFKGLTNNGNELPSGTYFYKIQFFGNPKSSTKTGYLSLKR